MYKVILQFVLFSNTNTPNLDPYMSSYFTEYSIFFIHNVKLFNTLFFFLSTIIPRRDPCTSSYSTVSSMSSTIIHNVRPYLSSYIYILFYFKSSTIISNAEPEISNYFTGCLFC